MKFIYLTLMAVMVLANTAMAQQNTKNPQAPESIQKILKEQGGQLFYLGEFEGMKGWAMVRGGKPEFFYENKDRTAYVMGLMFNDDGQMITSSQLSSLYDRVGDEMYAATGGSVADTENGETSVTAFAADDNSSSSSSVQVSGEDATTSMQTAQQPSKPVTKADRMYNELIDSNWVTMNPDGDYDIFAFIDPDCAHCQAFLKGAQPYLTDDGLRIRILPIGINEPSLRRAALMLASANPVDRLMEYVNGDRSALSVPQNIATEAAERNVAVMVKNGFDVTPIIVYRTGKGEIRLIRGRPSSYETIINDIRDN